MQATRLPDVLVGGGALILFFMLAVLGYQAFRSGLPDVPSPVVANQLRSIHQATLVYALDHQRRPPGLNERGELVTNVPAARFAMLLEGGYADAPLLISPYEIEEGIVSSFALPDLSRPGRRRGNYAGLASGGIMLSDRNIGADGPANATSLYSDQPGHWVGYVVRHDLSMDMLSPANAAFLDQPSVATPDSAAGRDLLFDARGGDDVYMIDAVQR